MNVLIGIKLKKMRIAKNWSQEQVADYLHVSQSTYTRMERGEGNSWANYTNKICDLYKITVVDLFNEENVQLEKISREIEEKLENKIKDLKRIVKYLKNKDEDKN